MWMSVSGIPAADRLCARSQKAASVAPVYPLQLPEWLSRPNGQFGWGGKRPRPRPPRLPQEWLRRDWRFPNHRVGLLSEIQHQGAEAEHGLGNVKRPIERVSIALAQDLRGNTCGLRAGQK